MVVFIGGEQSEDDDKNTPIKQAAQSLKNKGVKIYVVGIGKTYHLPTAKEIAGQHEVHYDGNWTAVEDEIVKSVQKPVVEPPTSTPGFPCKGLFMHLNAL